VGTATRSRTPPCGAAGVGCEAASDFTKTSQVLDAIGFVELSTAVDNFVRNCKRGVAKPLLQRQAQACCTNAAN